MFADIFARAISGGPTIKLLIQIPCLDEADHLPATLAALPQTIEGVDLIEVLVIDDGSRDDTAGVALRAGVKHIVRHRANRGLAAAFQSGMDLALRAGADIIVNTDADGQYVGEDIAAIVRPIVRNEADIVVGDRGVGDNEHFGPLKRLLQRFGSFIVRRLSRTEVTDAVSGFRAISREAALRIFITTEFSYTTDMLIQAGRKRMRILSVPIRTNPTTRPSRLFRSIPRFIAQTGVTIARAYTTYNPLHVFGGVGLALVTLGVFPIIRFMWFALRGDTAGHVQSLVIGGAVLILGAITFLLGMLADLISANRKLAEATLEKLRRLEAQMEKQESIASPDFADMIKPSAHKRRSKL